MEFFLPKIQEYYFAKNKTTNQEKVKYGYNPVLTANKG